MVVVQLNKRQSEVAEYHLKAEKRVLKELEKQYKTALDDINKKIAILQSDELTQSRIYRLEHQMALKAQVQAVLDKLHSDGYGTISQFLTNTYSDAWVGTTYDLFGWGVPLIMPVDPAEAVKAMPEALAAMKIDRGLDAVLNIARAGNRYFEKTAPWKLAKEGNVERLNTVLHVAAEALFKAAVLLNPVMPEKTADLGNALGYSAEEFAACRIAGLAGDDHVSGRTITDIGALFPRVEIAPVEEEKAPKAEKKAEPAEKRSRSGRRETGDDRRIFSDPAQDGDRFAGRKDRRGG